MKTLTWLSTLALTAALSAPSSFANTEQAEQSFIAETAQKYQLEPEQIAQWLSQAELNQEVLDAIQRPWEAKPWHQYYPIFLTEKRLNAGLKFWQQHQAELARAEQEFGVPAEVIVAIIGVETFYGSYKGKYPVLDALYTLGFHYPPRAKFFRSELGHLFALANEEGFDIAALNGSYAGAMGYGQFISSSYRAYAIDFDGDNIRDLLNNPVDAIGSVANYFARHGWQPNAPVAFELVANETHGALVKEGLKPSQTVAELQAQGLQLPSNVTLTDSAKAQVYAFEQAEGEDYWLGLQNFYVITRYNHSPLYAMVVHQFSQQLRESMSP
ncbi:lytic murein transglycosylase B [Pseudidiomarina taiwanensis]|uniref:Lytic murein transglycosylase B n=1 Tax=Pseudidiomarina taiwanensis TaxID=337250 RepID=A0A432ZP33_9GAMM|nr:lytic murein transglycosylase B [Pseudidiomarina taiwanensis]RUO79647.1 lytic murein transglycosylase B [Pseudidiomarina taiwanensis]